MGNFSTPGGQNADIIRATINGESYGEPPTSEISELLIELNQLLIAGGAGITNYNGLANKPQINGVELINNKTLADLGIVIPDVDSALSQSSENPVQNRIIKNALDGKQNALTFDAAPTAGSNNPVRSGGIKTALDLKQDVLTIDTTISDDSTNPVQNKAIALKLSDYYTKDEINDIVAALGTLKLEPVAELPTQDISTTTIYLLETATPGTYEQYLYLNGTWVLLGSTDVNLSNYYNKSQVDTLLLTKQSELTFDNSPTSGSSNPVKSGGIYTALENKQDTLTFDNAPTEDSDNPVKSGGVYTALENKQDTLTFDNAPTEDSDNPVKSGGIYTALENKQDTLTFDNEPVINSDNPVKSGGVYTELIKKLDKFYLDTSGLDLDDCTEAGLYEINILVANMPTGADGGNMLVSHNPTSGAIVQTYFATNGTIASRYKLTSAAWTSWVNPFTDRPALQYAKNVQYTSDAAGNIVLANSIDNVVIVSVRVRGNATWIMGYNDLAGYYIHLMDYSGQVLPATTVNLDIVYYSYDWTAA